MNYMLSGQEMTCPQLGPILLTIPQLSNEIEDMTLSASLTFLEEDQCEDLAEEDYPLVIWMVYRNWSNVAVIVR